MVARFMWPEGPAQGTYTIAPSPRTSLELDSHFPVRPQAVRVFHQAPEDIDPVLTALVGAEIATALSMTRRVGSTTIHAALTERNRFSIARLQAESPSTPPYLRELCAVMADAHTDNAPDLTLTSRTGASSINASHANIHI